MVGELRERRLKQRHPRADLLQFRTTLWLMFCASSTWNPTPDPTPVHASPLSGPLEKTYSSTDTPSSHTNANMVASVESAPQTLPSPIDPPDSAATDHALAPAGLMEAVQDSPASTSSVGVHRSTSSHRFAPRSNMTINTSSLQPRCGSIERIPFHSLGRSLPPRPNWIPQVRLPSGGGSECVLIG